MPTPISTRIHTDNKDGPFLDIGFNFFVNSNRVTTILPFAGKMVQTLYKERRDAGDFIDATRGRAKKSLIVLDNGQVVGSAFKPDTIIKRQL